MTAAEREREREREREFKRFALRSHAGWRWSRTTKRERSVKMAASEEGGCR